ncbi:nuclease A inhibitor family protein [Nostoc sp.]
MTLEGFIQKATQETDWYKEKLTVQKYRHLVEFVQNSLTDIQVFCLG